MSETLYRIHSENIVKDRAIACLVQTIGRLYGELEQRDKRIQQLLEDGTRTLERARKAEGQKCELEIAGEPVKLSWHYPPIPDRGMDCCAYLDNSDGEITGYGATALEAVAALAKRMIEDLRGFDLLEHLHRQRNFSLATFGPGERPSATLAHIRKELVEIEQDPKDPVEWIDVVLLAFDGAWRAGYSPKQITKALADKLAANEQRKWPDWRLVPEGHPVEHIRASDEVVKP